MPPKDLLGLVLLQILDTNVYNTFKYSNLKVNPLVLGIRDV
jgi:hypothetical protein